jgi:hypothetical protein
MRSCSLCQAERAAFELSVAMRPGDPIAVPRTMVVCAECHRLLTARLDGELATRMTEDYDDHGRTRIIEHVRERTTDVRSLPQASDAARRAVDDGFERLSAHTGLANEIAGAWPEAHRVARADLGEMPRDEDDDQWVVSSPWPSVTVDEVVQVIVDEAERDGSWDDDELWGRVGREVFMWDEPTVRQRLTAAADDDR